MKTADTKALELIETWLASPCQYGVSQRAATLQRLIAEVLKEQDKETRHSCAEAINALPWDVVTTAIFQEEVVSRDDAHAACMNVKAV